MILESLPEDPAQIVTTLGSEWSGEPFVVDGEHVHRYGVATHYPVEVLRSRDTAPPVFAAVASMSSHSGLLKRLVPRHLLPSTVHLAQAMQFHYPICVGDTISSRAKLVEIRSGSFGCAATIYVEVRHKTRLLAEADHRVLVRGAQPRHSAGVPSFAPPPLRRGDRVAVGQALFDIAPDQSIRYSEASGDYLAIHTDPEIARQAGFSGLVLHGLCTLALCARAAVEFGAEGDDQRLAALSATFTRPVYCGAQLNVGVENVGDGDTFRISARQDGRPVVRDAWAAMRT